MVNAPEKQQQQNGHAQQHEDQQRNGRIEASQLPNLMHHINEATRQRQPNMLKVSRPRVIIRPCTWKESEKADVPRAEDVPVPRDARDGLPGWWTPSSFHLVSLACTVAVEPYLLISLKEEFSDTSRYLFK